MSRRWFLAGGAAVVLGAGGGVAAGFRHDDRDAEPARAPRPPAALVAAAAAERALLADLAATTGGPPAVRQVITQAQADHTAHLTALNGLLAAFDTPAGSSTATGSAARGTPRTRDQLRAAEERAATAAAAHAGALTGPRAALLASIAACEAAHAELLR